MKRAKSLRNRAADFSISPRNSKWLIPSAAAVLLILFAYGIDSVNNRQHLIEQRVKTQSEAGKLRASIEGTINTNMQAVQGLALVLNAFPNPTQAEFSFFSAPLFNQHTQLRHIGAAPDMILKFVYPLEGNEAALGLNLRTTPAQKEAAERAEKIGKLVLAGPVNLKQGGQGFIGRIPVFTYNKQTDTQEKWGILSTVIDLNKFYSAAGITEFSENFNLAIRGKDATGAQGEVFFGEPSLFGSGALLVDVTVPSGSWQLAVQPKGGWLKRADNAFILRSVLAFIVYLILLPIIISVHLLANRHDKDLKFRGLFELSPVGIALNRYKDGKYVETNKALENMLGYSANELHRKSHLDITPPIYHDNQNAVINSLKNYGRYGPYEKEFIKHDGTLLPVTMNGMLVTDSNGEKLIWSIVEDITSRKQAELALAQNRKQLEQVIASTSVGIWDWNIITGEISINERWAHIIGYSLEELEPVSIDTWTNFTHPEDLEAANEKVGAHWRGENSHYQLEYRMRHRDGHWLWTLDSGKVIERTSDGKPVRMVGTHLDITEQKKSQKLIEQSKIELKNFFDLSPNFMCIIDSEGFFERVNDTFVSQLDFPRNDFFSCRFLDFVHPEDRDATTEYLESLLQGMQSSAFYNRFMHSNGDYLHLQWHTSADPLTGMLYATALNISNQKRDEKRMARQQEMLLSMSEQGRIGAWEADLEQDKMYWSTMTKNIYEVNVDYQPQFDKVFKFYKEGESRETIERVFHEAIQDGIPANVELPIITARGNERWVSVTGQPEFKHGKCIRLFGSIQDIDSRKRTERGIQQAHTELERQMTLVNAIAKAQASFIKQTDIALAFRNLLDGVLNITQSEYGFISEILYTENNAPYIKTHAIGNSSKHNNYNEFFEAQGTNPMEFYNLDSLLGAAITTCKPVIANAPASDSRRAGIPDGHPRLEAYLGMPIILNGSIIGLVGLANKPDGYDQSLVDWLYPLMNTVGQMIENTRAIRERNNAQQALVKAKNTAETAAKTKSEFLAMMSHEIRTPLNGVLGMLNLVQRTKLEDKQRYQVDIAKSSAESLLNLINDILDFSKVDAGKLDLEVVDFNLITLLENIAHAMAGRALERGNELIIDTTNLQRSQLRGDPSRLRQILVNLIGNAIKFTENGEITVTSTLGQSKEGMILDVSICDSGIGIPEDKIPHLFSEFTQVDASTTRKYGGTGLGLAICKKLSVLMGGDIAVTSKANKGSCFSFSIHVKHPQTPQRDEGTQTNQLNLENKTFFIAESNNKNTAILAYFIDQSNGKTSRTVSALTEPYQALCDTSVDYALIDTKLLTGTSTVLELKQHAVFHNTQWILTTTTNRTIDTENYAQWGFDGCLTKPITFTGFTLAITPLLPHTKQLTEAMQEAAITASHTTGKATLAAQIESTSYTPRILLVDDNTVNQEVAKMILEDFGLIIDVASNGLEALSALNESGLSAPYSLILMDCQMPEMDGYETTKQIRKGNTVFDNTKIPIIAMTANAMKGDKEKCLAAGMDDYLSKPIETDQLESMLKLWLPLHDFSAENTANPTLEMESTDTFWKRDELLVVLKGREDRLKILISSFVKRIPDLLTDFDEAVNSENIESLSFIAHSVKGSAGQLKCNSLFESASQLEQTAKSGDLARALSQSTEFRRLTIALCDLLNSELD